jgi:hypothetical protein
MLLTQIYRSKFLKRLFLGPIRKKGLTVLGTSIVETVVSMTILLTVLTLSMIRINQVNSSLNPFAAYKAYLATNVVLSDENLLIETTDEYEVEGFLVKKQLIIDEDEIIHMTLSVFSVSGKLQYTRDLIMRHDIRF